ncbi:D-alanyl-D-alanine carboxypeptidase/D-alanyl-D-alanine endopeptidase [Ideonella livida]|uniref:D-alanyl-D-alanine carboxypeptidase/D-alanyl-D-alanine-endopeptidase n=1 Tax=Ideonella livida TaxID=2707176 RepID=A0A7C9PH23_9BURK|nr:D-alanyl-D-alanine carboxypeptidase/D-alanyl-D-alanine-endopeptidase [Ideonella livida]NDY91150.1 D-alanyl-D-alanine carboxypeptidase/D-alanyl-D-alanine-endopeptidase [Ideonella livida]
MPPALPRRRWLAGCLGGPLLAVRPLPAWAQAAAAPSSPLPAGVRAALAQARLPESALAVWVAPAEGGAPSLAWGEHQARNPASLFKLVSTAQALDQLGPAFTWTTRCLGQGRLKGDVFDGWIGLRGSGDPTLVLERLWLLLRRLRQRGLRTLRGPFYLDRSAFAQIDPRADGFDGEASRPYNVRPDALMLNQRSVLLSFVPDAERGVAEVLADAPLAGWQVDRQVPLLNRTPCEDWRAGLKARLDLPERLSFAGGYPAACGERQWPVAYAAPQRFDARLIAGLWAELGGRHEGEFKEAPLPDGPHQVLAEVESPPLGQVVRDINKFSNNVMAEQLALTVALQADGPPATPAGARAGLERWLRAQLGAGGAEGVVVDNGSGLSRDTRLSAAQLGRLLQGLWHRPWQPEFLASLPASGLDGTVRRWDLPPGLARLKTGSLRDVAAVAGYVQSPTGWRVVVAQLQHEGTVPTRPVLEAVTRWALGPAGERAATPPDGGQAAAR